ncbi:hypothetical protein BSPA14S_I0016 (plasmid) [Borreliella spielmanii A14S]|uniref:Uncharacterized protein n=1 Tax=Borreliella spielmanii A14S TaxID=498742 RepID=C0RC95_9SPIR|nr:hypothetical protein BSPA14S_I0016 [Borreliella spielmanii A14S]
MLYFIILININQIFYYISTYYFLHFYSYLMFFSKKSFTICKYYPYLNLPEINLLLVLIFKHTHI